jgi:hypothetical protein
MTVRGNDAVRAQVRVMMADGEGLGRNDPVANAVISLVLESMGVEPAHGGENGGNRNPATLAGPARELAALRASDVLDRIELLTAVVDAAERYRRAERRGKGRKKARKRLFGALAAWREVVAGAG